MSARFHTRGPAFDRPAASSFRSRSRIAGPITTPAPRLLTLAGHALGVFIIVAALAGLLMIGGK